MILKLIKYTNFVKFYSTVNNISDVLTIKPSGTVISIKGWIKSLRNMKDNVFVDISDGSCIDKLQIVIPKSLKSPDLNIGASIEAHGTVTQTKKGQIELKASQITIVGDCHINDGYPFVPRQTYHPDYVRKFLHFRLRTNKFASLLRIRHGTTMLIHNYFNSQQFVSINTPVLTSNDCEGAGEVFFVRPENSTLLKPMIKDKNSVTDDNKIFFDKKVFLTVSGQMHLEAAAHSLSKVYTLGPTFRAENSKSRLHLSEFYMLEAEIAFLDHLNDLTKHVETLIKTVTENLLKMYPKDVNTLIDNKMQFQWLDSDFPILEHDEAVEILQKNKEKFKSFNIDSGLTKEHELFLVNIHNNIPVFIVNWPENLKPFYMKSLGNNKVAAFDLLVPNVGELVGGSLRENNYELLKSKIPDDLQWYLELRKFGGVPTGGYGLGFERYLQFILNIQNIKDTIPFPRWPHNCSM